MTDTPKPLSDDEKRRGIALHKLGPEHIAFMQRWLNENNATINDLKRQVAAEIESRQRLNAALREKDKAMGELFKRLAKASVDCSDLFS